MIYIVNSNNYILRKNLNQYHSRKIMYLLLNTPSSRKVGSQTNPQSQNCASFKMSRQISLLFHPHWSTAVSRFLEKGATHWILPVAAGYLPIKYRDHLAGGRLVDIQSTKTRNLADQCHRCMATYRSQRIAAQRVQHGKQAAHSPTLCKRLSNSSQ